MSGGGGSDVFFFFSLVLVLSTCTDLAFCLFDMGIGCILVYLEHWDWDLDWDWGLWSFCTMGVHVCIVLTR